MKHDHLIVLLSIQCIAIQWYNVINYNYPKVSVWRLLNDNVVKRHSYRQTNLKIMMFNTKKLDSFPVSTNGIQNGFISCPIYPLVGNSISQKMATSTIQKFVESVSIYQCQGAQANICSHLQKIKVGILGNYYGAMVQGAEYRAMFI